MGVDQLIHLLADSGNVGGLVVLSVVCFLWAQKVGELNLSLSQKMDELSRRDDQMVTALTELTLTLISVAPPGSKELFTNALKESLEDRKEERKGDNRAK